MARTTQYERIESGVNHEFVEKVKHALSGTSMTRRIRKQDLAVKVFGRIDNSHWSTQERQLRKAIEELSKQQGVVIISDSGKSGYAMIEVARLQSSDVDAIRAAGMDMNSRALKALQRSKRLLALAEQLETRTRPVQMGMGI